MTNTDHLARNISLDIIRSIAIFFVIGGHFFLMNTSLREVPFHGISLFTQAVALSLFFSGVPLFVMLTGYLNINKSCDWRYYRNIWKVLLPYIFFSLATVLFRKYYLHEGLLWQEWLLKVLDFSAIPYGWYIEMWIGLYLLTPFLNILYNNIEKKEHKLVLVGILFGMTILPHWLNRDGMHLLPGFWRQCWPLVFYLSGAYIQEFKPVIKKRMALLLIGCICILNPLLNLMLHTPTLLFLGGGPEDICSFFVTILLFLLLYQVRINNKLVVECIVKISLCSLDMYLCCYIFDALYYPIFKEHFYVSQAQFGVYFFILVPLVFASSLSVSLLRKIKVK